MEVTDEKSRPDPLVRGTDPWSGSVSKCHRSGTLLVNVAAIHWQNTDPCYSFLNCHEYRSEIFGVVESLEEDEMYSEFSSIDPFSVDIMQVYDSSNALNKQDMKAYMGWVTS